MKLKTRKSVSKRFNITKNGNILRRASGQDHFNARETGKTIKNKRRDKTIDSSFARVIEGSLH
ncbi:MAG: 50S ribosomal protein L35 [bacterium]